MFHASVRYATVGTAAVMLVLFAGLAFWEARADSESKRAGQPSPLLEPAKETYKATVAAFNVGTVDTVESLYVWSRRWMEAESASAADPEGLRKARQAHLDRMDMLHQQIATLFKAGVVGGEAERFHATQFYLAEAKLLMGQ